MVSLPAYFDLFCTEFALPKKVQVISFGAVSEPLVPKPVTPIPFVSRFHSLVICASKIVWFRRHRSLGARHPC